MKKLQSFFILKVSSSRLRDSQNNLMLSLHDAKRTNEVVRLGDNEVLRTLRKIKGITFDQNKLNVLLKEKKNIGILSAGYLANVEKQIDEMLFVPEIVSVVFENKNHYKKIMRDGLWVNGKPYVRLLGSAGMLRKNTVMFICSQHAKTIKSILNARRNTAVEIVPAKFSAYFGLYSSAATPVLFPRVCVIPDMEIERVTQVEFCDDEQVVAKDEKVKYNLFDGQGVISPRMAQVWASNMELDYLPAWFIFRAPFFKGLLATFDFHDFANVIAIANTIKDCWGNTHNIDEIDIIATTSQFKLWQSYESFSEYRAACFYQDLGFAVARPAPKKDKNFFFSNYQFLQPISFTEKQIGQLCAPTVDFFSKISGLSAESLMLYLLGDGVNKMGSELGIFDDDIVSALSLNSQMSYDPYIISRVNASLAKKKREAKLGKILMPGNFQAMISDPFAFCEHAFGLDVYGQLEAGECYSHFWLNAGEERIAATRAPMILESEINVLKVVSNSTYWYQYLTTGIVYNVRDDTVLKQGGADFDGDLTATTSFKPYLDAVSKNTRPVHYTPGVAKKSRIGLDDDALLAETDLLSFNQKIGFLTNLSTTLQAMLIEYETNSPEHVELFRRLKMTRMYQGREIDHAKGIVSSTIPIHWTKWQKRDGVNDARIDFENSLLVERRPYFFRYLYAHYEKRYRRESKSWDNMCRKKFGVGIDEIKDSEDHDKREFLLRHKKKSFFIDNDSTMNKICHYMENEISRIEKNSKKNVKTFDHSIMMDLTIPVDYGKLELLREILRKYVDTKRKTKESHYHDRDAFAGVSFLADEFRSMALSQVSSNICELANLGVLLCYEKNATSKEFVWKLFGAGIVENLRKRYNHMKLPVLDTDGDIEFLFEKYSFLDG